MPEEVKVIPEERRTGTEDRRKRINVNSKEILTEEQLKKIVNIEYSKFNHNYDIVKQAVDNMTEKLKKPIADVIGFADDALKLTIIEKDGKKVYDIKFNLTDEELNFLAIKIPTVCMYVQEFINDRALDVSMAQYMLEDAITENLKKIEGGDAKERMKFATQQAEIEQIVSMIKSQVYSNLKSYIERADKIYDGVKKVLDGRNKEKAIFGKYNNFSS